MDGGALEDQRAPSGGGVHEAGARRVRIDLRVAARSNRGRGVNSGFLLQLQAIEPTSTEAGGAPAAMLAFEPRGAVGVRRVVDGIAPREITPDVELPDRADHLARGDPAELPDATRARFAVTVGELGIIRIRLLHQKRGAGGGTAAAGARAVQERDAHTRAGEAPGDGRARDSTPDDRQVRGNLPPQRGETCSRDFGFVDPERRTETQPRHGMRTTAELVQTAEHVCVLMLTSCAVGVT